MKIIQKGDKQKVQKKVAYKVWETKCDRCGCIFEAEPHEFKEQCGLSTINCPQCGRELDGYRWEYSIEREKTKIIEVWED